MTDSSGGSAYRAPQGPYDYEMEEKPVRWGSQASVVSGSGVSVYSQYTPTASTYMLPIALETPNLEKKAPDNMGFAVCSLLVNPVFAIFAILLAEKSKAYFNRCNYVKARKYGQYAKGAAMGGIISMIIVLILIVSAVGNHYARYRDW